MRIYIRHAHKAYKNGKPPLVRRRSRINHKDHSWEHDRSKTFHLHDPPLTEIGKREAALVAEKLLDLYPTPTHIITSPYLRARETAAIMAGVIVKRAPPAKIDIICQTDIGEYLGNHAGSKLDVSPSTARHQPQHPETFEQFQERIKKHHTDWSITTKEESDEVTWVITHGIVISEIIKPWHGSITKIPYLGYIVMDNATDKPAISFGV